MGYAATFALNLVGFFLKNSLVILRSIILIRKFNSFFYEFLSDFFALSLYSSKTLNKIKKNYRKLGDMFIIFSVIMFILLLLLLLSLRCEFIYKCRNQSICTVAKYM